MRVAVWIILLCAASAVLSKPTHKSKTALKREMKGLLRKLRQTTDNCQELSESFGALAQHSADFPNSALANFMGNEITEENMERLIDMVYGFDIVNDDVAREQYTCAITQSQSLSQLKQALEDNSLLHNWFRFAYDYATFALPLGKQEMTEPSMANVLNLINALESAGLTNLDPDRVQLLGDMFVGAYYQILTASYVPAAPFPGDNNAKCSHVNNAFRSLVQEMVAGTGGNETAAVMQQITGLDVTDNGAMRNLICDLIDGADMNGGQGLYDALDNHGVFSNLFKAGYPYVQQYVPLGRSMLEQALEHLTNTIPPIGTNYPDYPGLPGGYNYYYQSQSFQSPTKRNHDDNVKRVHGNKAKHTHSLEEKYANSDDHKDKRTFDHKDKRTFDHKDKRTFDHKDKRTFDHKDKRTFDHKDKRTFDHKDKRTFVHKDKRSFDHKDKRTFDHKDKRSFDHKDKRSLDHKDKRSLDHKDKRTSDHKDKRIYDHKDKRSYGGQNYYGGGPNQLPSHYYNGVDPGSFGNAYGYVYPGYGGSGYGYPGYGGSGYGGPGYGGPGYSGPDYGGPGNGGPGSGGPEMSREDQIESTRLALDFLVKLEASNLLTLPNDL